jgi:histidine ammonia-lyase
MTHVNHDSSSVTLDGSQLTVEQVVRVARERAPVGIAPRAEEAVARSRQAVEQLVASGTVVYGITTGFGDLATTVVPAEDAVRLQENILLSHAVGTGPPLPEDVVRAMMLVRLNTLLRGYSGVRLELVRLLAEMLNRGVYPCVPEKGSLGASGDLAPSAHAGLVLLGRGEAFVDGGLVTGAEALERAGLAPIRLEPKEGLALCNGTQLMAGAGALLLADAMVLLDTADVVAGMSVEALGASVRPFEARVHKLRPYPGAVRSAENLSRLTCGSGIVASHANCGKVQDAYSLRCVPQVHGASRDVWTHVAGLVAVELNSVTDNPLIFVGEDGPGAESISAGNFHGQSLAMAFDYLAIALAELASISERRTFRLLAHHHSGLPPFLAEHSGLNSGYMLAQYTSAALVSENKGLCHPASVDTIPTSAGQEDHVSMGALAVMKARRVAENVATVLGIEALCAAQALDFWAPIAPGEGVAKAHGLVRSHVPHLFADRELEREIRVAGGLVREGALAAVISHSRD